MVRRIYIRSVNLWGASIVVRESDESTQAFSINLANDLKDLFNQLVPIMVRRCIASNFFQLIYFAVLG